MSLRPDTLEPAPHPVMAHAEWERVGGVFRTLGSPLRVGIVVLLRERARSVTELVDALGVSQPLVSQHLRVLRSSGLVAGERHGREMIYSLTDERAFELINDARGAAKPRMRMAV